MIYFTLIKRNWNKALLCSYYSDDSELDIFKVINVIIILMIPKNNEKVNVSRGLK